MRQKTMIARCHFWFNAIEAGIWIVLAAWFLYIALQRRSYLKKTFLVFSTTLFFFGISDIIETQTGAWYEPFGLFMMKAVCAVFIAGCLFQLFRNRSEFERVMNGKKRIANAENPLRKRRLPASAHKFNGPKGVGFLYKRDTVKLPPMIDGGHQESGLRAGTENVAGIVGAAVALRKNVENLDPNMAHLRKLESIVKSVIAEGVPDARFNGHPERHLPGLLSLSLPGMDAEGLLHILDIKGVAVSTGAACNSKETVLSHVLRAIRLPVRYASGTIRISFSRDNTEAEATALASFLVRLYRRHIG